MWKEKNDCKPLSTPQKWLDSDDMKVLIARMILVFGAIIAGIALCAFFFGCAAPSSSPSAIAHIRMADADTWELELTNGFPKIYVCNYRVAWKLTETGDGKIADKVSVMANQRLIITGKIKRKDSNDTVRAIGQNTYWHIAPEEVIKAMDEGAGAVATALGAETVTCPPVATEVPK